MDHSAIGLLLVQFPEVSHNLMPTVCPFFEWFRYSDTHCIKVPNDLKFSLKTTFDTVVSLMNHTIDDEVKHLAKLRSY